MRFGAILLAVLLLPSAALAGCIQLDDSLDEQSAGDVGPVEDVLAGLGLVQDLRIVSFDGTDLQGTVYLPDRSHLGCDENVMRSHEVPERCRVPVILELSPYMGNLATRSDHDSRKTGELAPSILYRTFLEHGYAIALVSVRGTGDSGGCFDLGGVEEQRDAYEVVEALADEPWSTGNVAMTGVSYPGTTPWEAAITNPPSLKAIVPVSGISDMYEYMFVNGVAYGHGPLFNTYYTAIVDWAFTPWDPWSGVQQADRAPESVCPDALQAIPEGYRTWADGDHDAFWDERDYAARAGDIEAAVMIVHGFQDWNVDPDAFTDVYGDLENAAERRILVGQWEHNIPWYNSFNRDWDYDAYNATVLAFLDRHLKGENATNPSGQVQLQDSSGRWLNYTTWPPARAQDVSLYLHPDALRTEHPSEADPSTFQSTPESDPGPEGLAGAQVVFETAPLEEPLLFTGVPRVDLHVSVDRGGGHVAAVLFEVTADGEWETVNYAYQSLAHRESRDEGEEVPAGEVLHLATEMYPASTYVEAGHKLVLVVAGEDPNRILEDWTQPEVTLYHDADRPSRLVLPVVPPEDGGLLQEEFDTEAPAEALAWHGS